MFATRLEITRSSREIELFELFEFELETFHFLDFIRDSCKQKKKTKKIFEIRDRRS